MSEGRGKSYDTVYRGPDKNAPLTASAIEKTRNYFLLMCEEGDGPDKAMLDRVCNAAVLAVQPPIVAHSKTEYKIRTSLGENVLPPSSKAAQLDVKRIDLLKAIRQFAEKGSKRFPCFDLEDFMADVHEAMRAPPSATTDTGIALTRDEIEHLVAFHLGNGHSAQAEYFKTLIAASDDNSNGRKT